MKGKNGVAQRELHVVDWQGESRPFVTGNISASSLAWSPGGRAITYLAKRGEDKHVALYEIPMDGGESQKSLGMKRIFRSITGAGQADRFLFVATEKAEENKAKEKGFNAEVYEEEIQRGRVWIARREGTEDDWEAEALAMEGSVFDARWSPEGRRLAVAVAPKPFIDFFYMYQKIKIVDADSGGGFGRGGSSRQAGELSLESQRPFVGVPWRRPYPRSESGKALCCGCFQRLFAALGGRLLAGLCRRRVAEQGNLALHCRQMVAQPITGD